MPITHTNRKGVTFYLGRGVTKTGKPRYFFAREPDKGEPVEAIPEGYEILESVNGVVSLAKVRPILIRPEELALVQAAVDVAFRLTAYWLTTEPHWSGWVVAATSVALPGRRMTTVDHPHGDNAFFHSWRNRSNAAPSNGSRPAARSASQASRSVRSAGGRSPFRYSSISLMASGKRPSSA
jgi:hypothetical protein